MEQHSAAGGPQWHKGKHELSLLWHGKGMERIARCGALCFKNVPRHSVWQVKELSI